MSARDEKATRYIASLDAARCSGSWDELPELIRKVTKHAPQRKCLIQTASAEHRAAKYAEPPRSIASSKSTASELSDLIPLLLSSIGSETPATDAFQAQACLAWIHWLLSEPALAASRSPKDLALAAHDMTQSGQTSSKWTEVCLLKSAYIKGASQGETGHWSDALQVFRSVLPIVRNKVDQTKDNPQFGYWSEQVVAQVAFMTMKGVTFEEIQDAKIETALQAFREWALLVSRSKEIGPARYGNTAAHISRLSTWQAYYQLLSQVLRSTPRGGYGVEIQARLKQSTELRRVEALYETELLRSTRFPKATESNTTIEEWVELVVGNWEVFCGPQWHDNDLGAGGRNAVGRNVLDILYRAATKTFHSTLILRRLFQVHKSLADFDLAYRALNTYIELIERGRERAEKSGEAFIGQDDDEMVFRTISEGIEALCSFGRKTEAKKSYDLSTKLEKWMGIVLSNVSAIPLVNGHLSREQEAPILEKTTLSRDTLGIAYRAIGIGVAHWSKWTPYSENRSSLQAKAIVSLTRAAKVLPGDSDHRLGTIYALSLLLAETREINQAIEYVKSALNNDTAARHSGTSYAEERRMIPMWHLLALLLTARQDFDTAAQTCGAAFEQFQSWSVLFGSGVPKSASNVVAEKARAEDSFQQGVVDDMEYAELQRIIEVRITELALTEVAEGPEEALNSSNDVLGLYFRLFGHLDVGTDDRCVQKEAAPPPSSAHTTKSFRGSLFGRRKQAQQTDIYSEKPNGVALVPEERINTPTIKATDAPTIHVTDQDEKTTTHRSHRFRRSDERSHRESRLTQKLHRREGSITLALHQHSKEKQQPGPNSHESHHQQSSEVLPDQINNESIKQSHATSRPETDSMKPQHSMDEVPAPPTSITHDSSPQAKQALPETDHNLIASEKAPPRASDQTQAREQDIRVPNLTSHSSTSSPSPHFPRAAAQKHALIVLVKIWLVISTLYRRANLFDDSREACDEAAKVAQRIEALVAGVESSARAFAEAGWGGEKSSDEIWADVFCDRAELALAIAGAKDDGTDGTSATGDVREAAEQFEQCLMYFPHHPRGIVGLSNVLLDFCERKVELGRRIDDGKPKQAAKTDRRRGPTKVLSAQNGSAGGDSLEVALGAVPAPTDDEFKKTPENLNRLAARDRAYGLLSTLTKLGTGWDDSEAWYALARAHELGGEIDKAKDILWWCVELEDRRPIRHWRNLGCRGYVL